MNDISTEVKTHVIVLKDGGKKFLTKAEYDVVWADMLASKKEILLNGSMLSVAMFGEVITLQEFYAQYPKERPPVITEFGPGSGVNGFISAQTIARNLKSMIKGITQYINGHDYKKTQGPIEIRKQMEARLYEVEHEQVK